MALDDYPHAFVSTLREIFDDVGEGHSEHVARLYKIWAAAQDDERHAAFRFMRDHLDRSEDKEGLVQLSWVIGNGTYRTEPDLHARPWWLENPEDWKAFLGDRIDVQRTEPNTWMLYLRGSGEHVARITKDDETGQYEVWHTPEDPAQMAEVRWHETWTAATQDVVGRQVMRQNLARNAPK
jgi:hypothetical protein